MATPLSLVVTMWMRHRYIYTCRNTCSTCCIYRRYFIPCNLCYIHVFVISFSLYSSLSLSLFLFPYFLNPPPPHSSHLPIPPHSPPPPFSLFLHPERCLWQYSHEYCSHRCCLHEQQSGQTVQARPHSQRTQQSLRWFPMPTGPRRHQHGASCPQCQAKLVGLHGRVQ